MTRSAALRSLLVAALLGIPISLAAAALLVLIHAVERAVWHDLPDAVGSWDGVPPAWYVIGVTTLAAGLAAALLSRVKSDVAHEVSLVPPPLRRLPWLLGGALATLAGGLVLGPEAPLLALGIALAGVAARRTRDASVDDAPGPDPYTSVLALTGAVIVLGMVLASPMLAIVLMLEILAASGRMPADKIVPTLVPAMLGAGIGSLIFSGVGSWAGFKAPTFLIPDLPTYGSVQIADLVWAPVAAVAAALVVLVTREASTAMAPRLRARPVFATTMIGLVTGVLAIGYRLLTDRPISDVLFSGQTALPDIVQIDAAWILLALVVAKGAAYSLALVGRLEGGQIFPALAMSGAVGVAASILLPGTSLTAMLAVAVAAGTTSIQRLPVFGSIFAVLIVGSGDVVDLLPLIFIASVIGWVVAGSRAKSADTAADATAA